MEDIRALVRAEMRYYQSRLDYSRHVMRTSFRFGAVAAFAFGAAAIGLVTGLIMTLAPLVGPGLATLLVTFGFMTIGAICAFQARKWVRKIYFPEIERDNDATPERSQGNGT
ncbi:MAG: phage holin family protein [Sphingomonadaceae bacterium]|nr:phage holin family protein [Sphingomonadaceae bacterium]